MNAAIVGGLESSFDFKCVDPFSEIFAGEGAISVSQGVSRFPCQLQDRRTVRWIFRLFNERTNQKQPCNGGVRI